MVNLETIGGRIIEVHLRFADQWPDLYGDRWVEALVRLYAKREWAFDDSRRRTGYSVVLFAPHGPRYRHPPPGLQQEIAAMPGISSLQITFHEALAPDRHAMPPGGFRVAIVNCWDRAAGNAAREGAAQSVLGRMIEKRTYDLAGKLEPTERPQTDHLVLPPPPRPRFKMIPPDEMGAYLITRDVIEAEMAR